MSPQEIITVTDNLVTLFISSSTSEDEIQNIIKTSSLDNIPETFIQFTNNKDIIDITLRSTAPTGKIEILENPINTLLTEKYSITYPQYQELGEYNNLSEKLEEKNTTSPFIEESTLGWLFNLPYVGIKKIFNPIKEFILNIFWTRVSSSSEETEGSTQVLNSGIVMSEGSISQEEQNRMLEEALPNTTVINNHENLSTIIKGKEAYKEPEISKWNFLVHIDVIIKLYNLFVEQQENALAKFSENSIAVQPRNHLNTEYLRIKEQLDEIMSTNLANKKDSEAFIKKTQSSNIKEVYVPSSDFILSQKSNLNLAEQQLPAKEDKGQSSGNNYINGVLIELPYENKAHGSFYQTYNNGILAEAEKLKVKNDIIKSIRDGEFTFTDAELNKLLNCAGRQLNEDPKVQRLVEFKLDVKVLKKYFWARTKDSVIDNNTPISILEIIELMRQFKNKDDVELFFPKINSNELLHFNKVFNTVRENVYDHFNRDTMPKIRAKFNAMT